ncbi:MAG: MBL fold metallo-hydrolase [Spirochaetales bacterium]|nr:MBL fold metallo-hydrolase [Spirochaetales bacterium]MCF7937342.1 MBL fold metallo-hydrolase [Spirochaetales bacterium]
MAEQEQNKVVSIHSGKASMYLYGSPSGYLLVDAGLKKSIKDITSVLSRLNAKPGDIKLIVITHGHSDHTGSLAEIKRLSGAPVMVHAHEAASLEAGFKDMPKGTGPLWRIMIGLASLAPKAGSFPPVKPDVVIQEDTDLAPYGFNGRAVFLPGHTAGSLGIITEDGALFCGDTLFHLIRRRYYPPFADDSEALQESWKRLLDEDIRTAYPGHGDPIDWEDFRRYYHERFSS